MATRTVNRTKFTIVGYWGKGSSPERRVDKTWKGQQRRAVLAFIKAGVKVNQTRGWANCRMCGEPLGSCDLILPGGKYLCPDKYDHYIKRHHVKPPKKFINAAVSWYTKHQPMAEKPFLKLVIDLRNGEVVYRRLLKKSKYGKK